MTDCSYQRRIKIKHSGMEKLTEKNGVSMQTTETENKSLLAVTITVTEYRLIASMQYK